jgi:LysM repeat protein
MGYVGLDSLKNETSFLNRDTTTSDTLLLDMLNNLDMETLDEKIYENDNLSLTIAIDEVVNTSSADKGSSYAKALYTEINKDEVRIIVVQNGDTLASLSEKYYGNSMAYDKIIASNEALSKKSSMIFVGQKIKLPY